MKTTLATVLLFIATGLCTAEPDPFALGKIYKGAELRTKLSEIQKANKNLPNLPQLAGAPIEWSTISQIDPHGIKVMDSTGIRKVPFAALSPKVRTAFGYDERKARDHEEQEKFDAEIAASQAERDRKRVDAEERLSVARREAKEALFKQRRFAQLRVLFKTDEGVAGFPRYVLQSFTPKLSTLGTVDRYDKTWSLEEKEGDEVIFIYGKWDVADGEKYQVMLIPVGTYSYTAVSGARKTVRSFAATVDEALELRLAEMREDRKDVAAEEKE